MGHRCFCRERNIEGDFMGTVCNMNDLERTWNLNNHYPIFTTLKTETITDKFKDFNYLSLGEILSLALLKYEKEDRKNHVIRELEKVFRNLNSEKLIIDNIDILFNPEYSVDILGYFIQLARNRKVIIIWPGEYATEGLTYASPEYEDYKKYLLKDYNIIYLK